VLDLQNLNELRIMTPMNLPQPLRTLLLVFVSFVVSISTVPAQTTLPAPQTGPILPRIIQLMQTRLNAARIQGQFPGAQVGFVYVDGETPDGKPRIVTGSVVSGVADLQTNAPLKSSNRMLAGSIGKTFVAALTMMLVQDGKLNLDDKIEKTLGVEPWFSKLPNARDITLQMLLNHSSGIENHVDIDSFRKQDLKSAARNIGYEELVAFVLNKKPLFPAGTGFNYADTNYILVGMIIEKTTGRKLYDLVDERILKPFRLDRTIPSNSLTLPDVANGYYQDMPLIVNGKFRINPQWEWAGGGFASNAEDLARWANMLYGGEVLSAKSLEEMFSSTSPGEGSTYGLGTMVTRSKWGRAYGHDGEFPGYLADMRYYSKYKIAVAVMVNSDETPGVNSFLSSAADDFAGVIIGMNGGKQVSQAEKIKIQTMSESWLSLIYAEKFDESWEQLDDRLKRRFPKDAWARTMKQFLEKVGKFNSRKLRYVVFPKSDPSSVVIDFESSFSKGSNSSETLTWEMDNGVWKVSGYTLH
jgi:D-alanyl-D-alanine carboxypeptidase